MKTQSDRTQRWEDIIFENRNKEYGAYAIRKNYDANVLKAEIISIGIGLLIFIVPVLFREEQIIVPFVKETCSGLTLYEKPVIMPRDPATKTQPAKRVKTAVVPTRVTDKEVIDKPVDPVTETSSSGLETGAVDTGSATFIETGTGTTPDVVVETKPFTIVQIMPEYEGGDQAMMRFIQNKLRYPKIAIRKGDHGTVYVSFVISADGSVANVAVVKGISKECDEEAVRVISMMERWKPGIQNNMAVAVRKVLPITFRLD